MTNPITFDRIWLLVGRLSCVLEYPPITKSSQLQRRQNNNCVFRQISFSGEKGFKTLPETCYLAGINKHFFADKNRQE